MHIETLGRVLIVVPTYNERDNLDWIIGRLRVAVPEVDVLVVDDSSPDGTGEVADRIAAADAQVSVLHRPVKAGLGAAYLHGFAEALARGYDVVGEMDADGSHQPEQLPMLLSALSSADVVIGSRWVRGGRVVYPLSRKLLSVFGNLYARFLLGVRVRDLTAGYKLYRADALRAVDLAGVESSGYVFQADMVWRCLSAGLRVVEVPIEFVDRIRGTSKMDRAVAVESMRRITGWGLAERRRQARGLASRARARTARKESAR